MLHPHAKTQEARKKYLERGENTQDVQAQWKQAADKREEKNTFSQVYCVNYRN